MVGYNPQSTGNRRVTLHNVWPMGTKGPLDNATSTEGSPIAMRMQDEAQDTLFAKIPHRRRPNLPTSPEVN